jgi:hypothetical protein
VVAGVGVGLWAAIDAGRRPDHQFAFSGENKVLWIALPLACLGACQPAGIVVGLIYLVRIRPRLDAVASWPIWPAPWPVAPGPPGPWFPPVPSPAPPPPRGQPAAYPSPPAASAEREPGGPVHEGGGDRGRPPN